MGGGEYGHSMAKVGLDNGVKFADERVARDPLVVLEDFCPFPAKSSVTLRNFVLGV